MHFLIESFKLITLEKNTIFDRNIHETLLFARAQYESGYMQPQEYQLLLSTYRELDPIWPDLVILIDIPPTVTSARLLSSQKLHELTKNYAEGMTYLKKLYDLYKTWEPECDVIRITHADLDRRVVGDPRQKLAEIVKQHI